MIPGIGPTDHGGASDPAESVEAEALFPTGRGLVPVGPFFLKAETRSKLGAQL